MITFDKRTLSVLAKRGKGKEEEDKNYIEVIVIEENIGDLAFDRRKEICFCWKNQSIVR